MKHANEYKVGDVVNIYSDYENNVGLIGAARLVKLHGNGRSFILEEVFPEKDQIVYNYQTWWVEFEKPLPSNLVRIRYVDSIGLANSASDEETDAVFNRLEVDKFLSVNGKEIY